MQHGTAPTYTLPAASSTPTPPPYVFVRNTPEFNFSPAEIARLWSAPRKSDGLSFAAGLQALVDSEPGRDDYDRKALLTLARVILTGDYNRQYKDDLKHRSGYHAPCAALMQAIPAGQIFYGAPSYPAGDRFFTVSPLPRGEGLYVIAYHDVGQGCDAVRVVDHVELRRLWFDAAMTLTSPVQHYGCMALAAVPADWSSHDAIAKAVSEHARYALAGGYIRKDREHLMRVGAIRFV